MAAEAQAKDDDTPLVNFPKLGEIVKQWTSCADCDDPNPKWADISRGILICLQCAGVHRMLGTHVSKVRSITLDKWSQDMVDNMQPSNIEFNKIYEYNVPKEFVKPRKSTNREIRTKYITAKYIGLEAYKDRLIPAFHKDQNPDCQQPLKPVFASADYDTKNVNAMNDEKEKDNQQGMAEYTGVIQISKISAKDLPKADLLSDSDPYVIFRNANGQSVKTKVIDNDNNPKWDKEHLVLSVNENIPINIEIWDEDNQSKDDLLCTQEFNVGKECKNGEQVIAKLKMEVNKKYKKQKKQSALEFTVQYDKMDAQ